MIEYINAKKIVLPVKPSLYWFSVKYSLNIYHGCSHGCIYCDSRSSCYNISDFDRIRVKKDAIKKINDELKNKRVKGIISTGAMSDPYNPLEKKLHLTRDTLKLIDKYKFGVSILTKSDLITRDIDILKNISKHSDMFIAITVTTFDDNLCKIIEPNVCVSSKRFEAIKKLSENGIYTGILLQPILPFINDDIENIRNIVHTAYKCGAKFIYPAFGVTLRDNQREYYYDKLDEHFPNIKMKYINEYKNKYSCNTKNNELYEEFKTLCEMYGIKYKIKDIVDDYTTQDDTEQLSLF